MLARFRFSFAASLLAACALLLLACGEKSEDATTTGDTAWEGEEIAFGSVYSQTGAGAAFGPQQLQAAELAVEQINADGGIHGAELQLQQVDDRSEPTQAARAARELISEDDVLAVLGPTFSNSAVEAHPLADELGVAMLATSNTGPGIVGDCAYPCELVFRDSLGEEQAIPANVESFAAENPGAKSAVVLYPADDPFGESTAKIAAGALTEQGIDVFHKASVPAGRKRADAALRTALREKPDVLFITASSGETAATLIDAARSDGFSGAILGGNAFNSALAAANAGRQGNGARSAAAWFEGNEDPENTAFVDAYRKRYDESPDQFAAQAYTGVQLLAQAAASGDLNFEDLAADRQALADALAGVQMPTPLGEFSFTEDHDVSQPIWIVEMDGKGGYKLLEQLDPPAA